MPDQSHHIHPPHGDAHELGASLGPVLIEVCGGRLGPIEWFRCAWQHGGAATGFAEWRGDDGRAIPAMVKLPVGPTEHRWTTELCSAQPADTAPITPRVLAAGTELGGYELAWLVIERLPGQPLSRALSAQAVMDLLDSATHFHAAAAAVRAVGEAPKPPDWESLLTKGRELTKVGAVNESQRWNEAVKKVQRALPVLQGKWMARRINTWCHGDLHPGNAMRRDSAPEGDGACVLLDLAMVHAGHWVEDGVYLERLHWGRTELLHGVKPVSYLAKLRRERGLACDDNYAELAAVRRVLMAGCVPAYVGHEGHPKYTHAALELLEQTLPQVVH